MILINDDNWQEVVQESQNQGFSVGALPRQTGIGEMSCATVFAEQVPIIPESEWKPRIAEMTASGLFIGQRWKSDTKLDYQNGLGFCWAKSLAQACMAVRAAQNQPFVQLMGESLEECVGYRNKGYYLDRALEYANNRGIASIATVPHLKITQGEWNPQYAEERQSYMPLEWWDLGGKEVWAETITALLMGYGCYVGYDWWGHAVFLDMLRVNAKGQIEVHTPNTHGQGNDAWLAGSKAIPSMGSFVLRGMNLAA